MSEYVYGIHAVSALLDRQPQLVKQLLVVKQQRNPQTDALATLANQQGLTVTRVSKDVINNLFSQPVVHQGVVVECHPAGRMQEADLYELLDTLEGPQTLLILDGVQDPHNLGACLRSAAAFGVAVVIAPKDKSVGLTPTVSKVSCGGAYLVPFVQVTNLVRCMRQLQEAGFWLVGLAGESDQALHNIDMTGHIGLVMGSEGKGLRVLTRKHCDYLAKIAIDESIESLNVSVAAGIALYEVKRQRL